MSRSLVHLLLSLLLLVSQQLSLGHGYTHLRDTHLRTDAATTAAAVQADTDGKPAKPGLHDLCAQCAAGASIAFALPPLIRRFAPADLAYAAPHQHTAAGIRLLAASAFQPRAPPRA